MMKYRTIVIDISFNLKLYKWEFDLNKKDIDGLWRNCYLYIRPDNIEDEGVLGYYERNSLAKLFSKIELSLDEALINEINKRIEINLNEMDIFSNTNKLYEIINISKNENLDNIPKDIDTNELEY